MGWQARLNKDKRKEKPSTLDRFREPVHPTLDDTQRQDIDAARRTRVAVSRGMLSTLALAAAFSPPAGVRRPWPIYAKPPKGYDK